MPTITKKHIGDQQFGGFTPYGNITNYRATLQTTATGAVADSDSSAQAAVNDVIRLQKMPAGYELQDAQIIISDHFGAGVTGSLGFLYADGVDSSDVAQDAAYFGAGLVLSAAARLRTASSKVPVKLPKEAYLVLTVTGAAVAEVGRADFIVSGERFGPK